ncbi:MULTISPECIES: heavy metal-binding domain-containing protein [Flavobacterium]|nr:heavy metal-binding domain-containing protein [Flavobacterium sp. N1846]
MENCPNCQVKMTGMFNNNFLLSKDKNNLINVFSGNPETQYCNKCGEDLYLETRLLITTEKNNLLKEIEKLIFKIPVISIQAPLNWDYEILDMITGQTTTGTGVISEFTSTFSDIFGVQSERFNKKLKNGEDLCFTQLRKKTIDIGGNAVIATDIDYSEIGGDKGMLMVCMGGTAVKLKNLEILGEERSRDITRLTEINSRFNYLSTFPLDL